MFDLIVLGGGPGGVASARRAAQLGAKVALVDADWRQGRAIRGWLPKRFLAQAARASDLPDPAAAFRAFQVRRDRAVGEALAALVAELDEAGVEVIAERAALERLDAGAVLATRRGRLEAPHLVLAVGASPTWPAWGGGLIEPAEALYADDGPLPSRVVIVGGGYIATAQAALLRSFGVDVTLILPEAEPLGGFDDDLRRVVGDRLSNLGVRLRPETEVIGIAADGPTRVVATTAGTCRCDRVAFAAERAPKPNTAGLDLARFGVRLTVDGAVQVDVRYAASVSGLHAIGDCADHAGQGLDGSTFDFGAVAVAEGEAVVEHLFDPSPPPPLDYDHVPIIVQGRPEIAAVGLGEARARALGFDVLADGRQGGAGFVKLVADRHSGRLLGCHLVGEGAGALVQGLALALGAGADLPRLRRTVAAPHGLAEELLALAKGLG
ncbi:MAG: NAD(P)/FAD-dependent oxidoreductase [Geminicoccaceae bacterium]|nr:MAG: NAD(P)/FAD-dependent oxidoreductase [Geminicoccaceae bacterium]